MKNVFSIAVMGLAFLGLAAGADTTFDPGQDSVTKTLAESRGLIVRVPVGEEGEDTKAAEFRVVDSSGDVMKASELVKAWETAKEVQGFAELSKPEADASSGASTRGNRGYWGGGCTYYYEPVVYYNNCSYSYNPPVYYHSTSYSYSSSSYTNYNGYSSYSSYSYSSTYTSYSYYYYPSRSYYSSYESYPAYYGYGSSYYHNHHPYEHNHYRY